MSLLNDLPDNSVRRLTKVVVRTLHLIGMAGMFGAAMDGASEPTYFYLAMISGVVLVGMEAYSGWIWFVQLRGVAVYVKLLLLALLHVALQHAIVILIGVIAISGFMSHAPGWIRYYSLLHRKVVYSQKDLLG
ncbi:hypothetical protein [Pelovirga terrestris]|uniref:Uncharacterized protein n=1 Tax=Pelovirga terrestris TaxID=2771352 RepID=A0A8J6URS1_9BACT|nr:hypothetical protein [Pelovirga terrestris]MBD1401821.1 hypothetical protein [Pelovirga terrestris]